MIRFLNRSDAGRQLSARLAEFQGRSDVVVLGLPRGGVPVAKEVADGLDASLDVMLVRKLGVPGHSELAMGAIAEGGVEVLNEDLIRELEISESRVQQVEALERLELERREALFRKGRPALIVRGRTVIVVDDGLATGATMQAAVLALRKRAPALIIVAVPVGAPDTCERLGAIADRVVCLHMPEGFGAVGEWYEDFSQISDDEVARMLS